MDYAARMDASAVLRGIRAISDYEYELQMALMNRKLEPDTGDGVHDAGRQVFLSQFAAGAGSGAARRTGDRSWCPKWWSRGAGKAGSCIQNSGQQGSKSQGEGKRRHDHGSHATALKLTERINRIEPSATMAVVAEAESCAAGNRRGRFRRGRAAFCHAAAHQRCCHCGDPGQFHQVHRGGGTAELRDAIVHRHAADFDSDYRREEAIASTGGKHALFNAIQVLVDHGDEVILPVPYWVSFKDIVRYAGGELRAAASRRGAGLPRDRGDG